MTALCAILFLLLAHPSVVLSSELPSQNSLDSDNPAVLREANRVLEEELKLAGRPHPYLVLDLPTQAVFMKGRGIELHRLPVLAWHATDESKMTGVFRLTARPPIVRRKAVPTDNPEQEPISLNDMPVAFELHFQPPLTIRVVPHAREHPWQWLTSMGVNSWSSLTNWITALLSGNSLTAPPTIRLTLGAEKAQSLAWSVTEGMPLLIRRTTDKE